MPRIKLKTPPPDLEPIRPVAVVKPRQARGRIVLDFVALGAMVLWLASVLALLTESSAGPDANLLGRPGSAFATFLSHRLGLAALPTLGMAFMLILTLLLEGRRGVWLWRLLGWQALVPATALLAELAGFPSSGVLRSGGQLGADLHAWLSLQVTHTGEWLIGLALLVGGLGLAFDFAWPSALRLAKRLHYATLRWIVARRLRQVERQLAERQRREQEEAEARAATIPIRVNQLIGPKLLTPLPDDEPLAEEEEEESPEEEPRPTPAVSPAVLGLFSRATDLFRPAAAPELPEVGGTPAGDGSYKLPPLDLLEDPEPFPQEAHEQTLRERAVKLEKVLADFGLKVKVVGINTGPVITQFEIALETGVRLSKVTVLADDIALNLKVPSVRVVAPLPGKDTVGIEVPNDHRATVKLKECILAAGPKLQKMKIPLFLGKDAEGRTLSYDLADMPHLLIAGRTGTGKSVCMNAIILSILMTRRPDEVKMIMIDPKMLEMSEYSKVPHLMHPVVKDMRKAEAILSWAVDKMEERYDILSRARVRSIAAYNELPPEEIYRRLKPADDEEKARIPERMPYIVIFVDEMNDLMMMMRKEVEAHIIRLAQKSRAAGIHLVVATQKPTVDVITGLIKSNLPARICFQVSSRSDSRVVLDEMGAEKLLGRGDMLFLQPGTSTIVRAQGTFAGDRDIAKVVDHLECEPAYTRELVQLQNGLKEGKNGMEAIRARDELYEQAIEIVIREQRGSTSLLQRAMGIGYGRAARLIDFMAEDGIVGAYNGSSAREVLIKPEEWDAIKTQGEGAAA